ncbi:MAG: DAK2 domain-containing protein [Clostridiales bacterium]|nr:DAK2 domain-containing protein [Clostridiales bacterium]
MLKTINASCYSDMLKYGVNHLENYCEVVNDLNVFPVPDGDTGTNMVMTLKNGLGAMGGDELGKVAQSFANATVFGARGNSGVIISQFFKGVSEGLKNANEADAKLFSKSLDMGCDYAYAAVATPVEGTVLTVMKDATTAVREELDGITTVNELVDVFLKQARITLENTPNLLEILAKAGVIDSGGAGLVYFFEGIERYLKGEALEQVQSQHQAAEYIDYSKFNRFSKFEFGYCTETLLQLTVDENDFDRKDFSEKLQGLGESIVTSFEGDKVKVHVHTHTPERVLEFCHQYGEFLSLKIENMSVQHTQTVQKYLCATSSEQSSFAVVAVAPNATLQKMLSDMGADVVVLSAEVPSSQDFIEAYEHTGAKHIIVFPNNANSILSAKQAGKLYKQAEVEVIKSKSIAECYSALAVIDFSETDVDDVVDVVEDTIDELYEVSIVRAAKNTKFGSRNILKGDYFAMSGDDVIQSGGKLEYVVWLTVNEVVEDRDCGVINMFYGKNVTREQVEAIANEIEKAHFGLEVCLISTEDTVYDLILSFE